MNSYIIKILLAVSIMALVGCGGAEDRKAAYMEKARESYQAGNYAKARIDAKNAVQIDPKFAEAHFMIANVFEKQEQFRKAFRAYSKAAEYEPGNAEYQAKLGTFYLMAGDKEKVQEIIDIIDAIDPNNLDKQVLGVGILVRDEKIEEAKALARKIADDNPQEVKPLMALVQLYKREQDYASALDILNRATKLDDDDLSIKKDIINMNLKLKNYDEAERLTKIMVSREPTNLQNRTLLAALYKERGDFDAGEKVLREAIDLDDSTDKKLTLAGYINETRGAEAAEKELKSMMAASDADDINEIRLALAQLYRKADRKDEEIGIYKDIISTEDESATGMSARVNLCKLYMSDKEIDKAKQVIDEALKISPNDSEMLLLRASISLINDDIDNAITDLRLVVKENPELMQSYKLLVDAYLKQRDMDQVRDTLNKAYDNNIYNAKSLLELAELQTRLKNIDGAEKAIDAALRIDENNASALVTKIKILNTRKDFEQSRKYATQLIRLNPEIAQAYLLAAPAMMNAGEFDELKELLEDGYDKTGKDLRILQTITAIDTTQKRYDDAINRLVSELDKRDDDVELYRLMGKVNYAAGNFEEAINSYKKGLEIKNDSADLYMEMANIYTRKKEVSVAVDVLKQGKSVLPDNKDIRMSLALLYQINGQPDSAIDEYDGILAIDENNVVVINNLAALLAERESDVTSLDRALKLVEKLEGAKQPAIQDTVGWVYYKAGKYPSSVKVLESVVEQSPDTPIFSYHLGMAYLKSGDKEKARQYLEKSVASETPFSEKEDAEQALKEL